MRLFLGGAVVQLPPESVLAPKAIEPFVAMKEADRRRGSIAAARVEKVYRVVD